MGRRSTFNPLATSLEPRWLQHVDMLRRPLSSVRIEPGADLVAVLRAEAERCRADGWTVESDDAAIARWGWYFMHRGGDRIQVLIVPAEKPEIGHTTA